ncbi:response regulator [Massilia dura]|uniref:histidine kinase n=1 Tax=Pseudoduganella dura TaxID=321982 RepID=A0A6I3XVQ3_9BURK|nr:response regulator [Pseudoduganella dura]MUI16578.1 response regulator [Pseudoduganella dura]GGY02573.1 two-component system sensor histidine kinase/response regulator [Pseudoduganella dura]
MTHISPLFLPAGSRTAELIRAFPWADTALGAMHEWHPGMKTTVALILQSPVPIVTLWGPLGYMIYNDAYSEFAGARHPTLLGSEVRKGWPEVADFNDNVMRVVLRGGKLSYVEQELTLHRSGQPEPVWMNLDYSPVTYEDGTIGGVFAVVVETSAKVRAERSLRESEASQKAAAQALARMNATLESQVAERTAERDRMWRLSKDILLVAGFDARLTAVSPAFTSILGWQAAEVIGQSFLDLVHPEDRETTVRQVSALSAGAHVFRFENRYRRKDGSYCSLSWTASPDARYIHAIGRDITADIEQAEAMRRTEAALQHAQKMETIGKLTGGVAHDFNNLLQVISGNLQLMAPRVADRPEVMRRLENARAGVERGARLAGYLLAFARRQPLEPKVVKVSRLIAGMEDMLRRTLGEEVEIETVMSGGLWSASIDVAQVENAILNLAINARDAMNGHGRLTIEVNNALLDSNYCASHLDVVPGQYVMVAVSDTGTGMSAEVMAQAFEPFFSTKPEGKGTGLGLSMVYGLVKQSGGHVKIYSEPGLGTTVKLYLPRTREAEDAYTVLDATPATGGTETVLVAEDDDEVRGTVVDMLTELGYRVLKAHDAAAALTVIDSGIHVDLLFTDVVMPGTLRSPDLARKARERLPDLAVVFTSGYTENAIVHGGRLDPGVELIGKPYTKESLARKIRHVLAGERQRARVPGAPAVPWPAGAVPVAPPPSRLKVLLVEDEEAIRANTRDMIEFIGHEVIAVASAEEALALLGTQIDVLITDQQLPGMQGIELVRLARQRVPHLHTAIASGFGTAPDLPGTQALAKPYGIDDLRRLIGALGKG